MAQIYKIYINESVLILSDRLPSDIGEYREVNPKSFEFTKFYAGFKKLDHTVTFLLLSVDFKRIFKKIKRSLELICAAGGLVSNEENKYLFIFRKGKWDLPKGKLDEGESFRTAAVREVEEECGIEISHCEKKLSKTYHIYEIEGVPVIKKTVWYRMRADNQPDLIPQIEEDITEARWLLPGDLNRIKQNTYPLICEVLREAGL